MYDRLIHVVAYTSTFLFLFLFFFFLRFYLFIHERHTHTQRGRDTEEKQAPCRKPIVGLDPRTPGSRPGPKAGAKSLSHPGIPSFYFQVIFHCIDIPHFVFPFIHPWAFEMLPNGYLAIVNTVAVNMGVQICL